MNFNTSIIEAVTNLHSLKCNKEEIEDFLKSQIEKLPDYLRLVINTGSFIFNYFFTIIYLRQFLKLSCKKRTHIIFFIKKNKIPIVSTYLRFFESMIILKAFDSKNEN